MFRKMLLALSFFSSFDLQAHVENETTSRGVQDERQTVCKNQFHGMFRRVFDRLNQLETEVADLRERNHRLWKYVLKQRQNHACTQNQNSADGNTHEERLKRIQAWRRQALSDAS